MKEKENLGSALIMVAFGILVGVAISFCFYTLVAPSEEQVSIQEEESEEIGTLERGDLIKVFHDDKRNVTCWVWSIGTARGGISCIPDHMLSP